MPESSAVLADPAHIEAFLLEVADAVNTMLDLDKLLQRVAEIVRNVVDYELFAILLLNERTQELRIRFAIGHAQNVIDTCRIKLGEGITGQAALRREAVLVGDVSAAAHYIAGAPGVRSELAVPLICKNKVIGVIDVEASKPDYFTAEDKLVLTLVASRIAVSIENAHLYTRASRQARSLAVLNEIARDLTSILNLDDLFKHIGEQLKRLTDYQLFSVFLLDKTGGKLENRFSLRYGERIQVKHDIRVGDGLVGYAALHKEPVVVPDVARDPRYINLNPDTRSELVVPLIYKGNVIGVLDVEHTKRGYFVEQHVRTLTTLAAQVAIAIENARLYETVARQEQQMQHDLELARELQIRILPPAAPRLRAAQVFARFHPARIIGGDLYDFVPYSRERMGFAIGDVSGKGAPAAIYAALVSGFLRSHARHEPGPAKLMRAINHSLTERPISAQYVSMIFALWEDGRQRLQIANSGLPRPIHCHKGQVTTLRTEGLPLGLFPNARYDELVVRPQPGDLVVFFSDGITDASDAQGKMFGRTRLEQVVTDHRYGSAQEVGSAIFSAVSQHAAGVEIFDDQTVVVLKVRAHPGAR
jgi:sigma-B regulation protein RsbU (phosphoserine phosphatase)